MSTRGQRMPKHKNSKLPTNMGMQLCIKLQNNAWSEHKKQTHIRHEEDKFAEKKFCALLYPKQQKRNEFIKDNSIKPTKGIGLSYCGFAFETW